MADRVVQGWDLALFHTEPARTWAGSLPSRPLSEVLHLAYILYYAIIYVPPAVLYSRRGYNQTVFAMTLTVVVSFAAFSVFPGEGPRFAWGPPPGVPSGPIPTFTLLILGHRSPPRPALPS